MCWMCRIQATSLKSYWATIKQANELYTFVIIHLLRSGYREKGPKYSTKIQVCREKNVSSGPNSDTNFQQKRIIANNQDMYNNIFNPNNLRRTLKSNVVHYKMSSNYCTQSVCLEIIREHMHIPLCKPIKCA